MLAPSVYHSLKVECQDSLLALIKVQSPESEGGVFAVHGAASDDTWRERNLFATLICMQDSVYGTASERQVERLASEQTPDATSVPG